MTILSAVLCVLLAIAAGSASAMAQEPAGKRGADVPWITYEAEDATFTGTVVRTGMAAQESSGGSHVVLREAGQYVEFVAAAPANRLVLRYSVPADSEGTLNVYVNGESRPALAVSAVKLYEPKEMGGQKVTVRYFDETDMVLEVQAGDTVRLQKNDSLAYVAVDLVDLELAPPPLEQPEGYISVTDYGAVPDDGKDDTEAITRAVLVASAKKTGVWFPPGKYHQSSRITVPTGVHVMGAGVWHTVLYGYIKPVSTDGSSRAGFQIIGDNVKISHMRIWSAIDKREKTRPAIDLAYGPKNWTIENLWIEYTNSGIWLAEGSHGVVRNNRIRSTYADGIHVARNTYDIVIENNHIRGCGDDAIAVVSSPPTGAQPARQVVARRNTGVAGYWGRGMAIVGGTDILYEENIVADIAYSAGIYVATETAYPTHPVQGATVRRNTVIRSGGDANFNKPHGAIYTSAQLRPIYDIKFLENEVIDARRWGIYTSGKYEQSTEVRGNVVRGAGAEAYRNSGTGNIVFADNRTE